MSVFMHLYQMYEEELYSNCHTLAQFFLNNPALFQISQDILFCINVINANSLWEMKHYTESQKQYESAMIARRSLDSHSTVSNFSATDRDIILGIYDNFNETEIKFRIAKCLVEDQKYKEANTILQSIPLKQRPTKVHDLICKVQLNDAGTDKTLIMAYKEILKKCPLAFECIDGLLAMGVKGSEVHSLIINVTAEGTSFDWLNRYVRALSEVYSRKYADSIVTLASIDSMKNHPRILAQIGECFFFSGDYETAYSYLKKSYDLYPFMKVGIQKYAILCEMFKKHQELGKLIRSSTTNANVYEYTSENWFVLATYLFCCQKYEKAQYFINRIILQHQQRNVDALILHAKILHSMKKSSEALISLRQALKYEPYRFEAHRWLVEILLRIDRPRDAQNQATKALKILGDSPRTLTLAAGSFLAKPRNKEKSKALLQKALEMNEHYAKAVFFYAKILNEEKDYKASEKLLEKTVPLCSNIKLMLMLGDLYAKNKNMSASLEIYTKVLNLEPSNRHALHGVMALGHCNTLSTGQLDSNIEDDDESDPTKPKERTEDDDLIWSDDDDAEVS